VQILPFVFLIVGGFFGGFFGAAVGSAGLVSLPILLLLGLSPHVAIGTTRPAAVVLEMISAIRYAKEGVLTPKLFKQGLLLGIAAAVGSTIGAILLAGVSDQMLRLLLAIIITTMVIFLFTKKKWGMTENLERQRHTVLLTIVTCLTGLYAGLFGFTFGTVITIVLVSFGFTLLRSAAMGRVIGLIASTASGIILAWHGYVHIPYSIALSIGFALGSWFGAKAATRGGNTYIKLLFIVVVLCSVAKLLFDYVQQI